MIATPRRYLVVVRAGADSLHPQWIDPQSARDFDLFISAYSPQLQDPKLDGVAFEYRPGRKVAGYHAFLQAQCALWQQYDYIALFDDDLAASPDDINRLFSLSAANQLRLAQPSLSHDSYFTYAGFLHQRSWQLRYMTQIEMMCPVFRRDALEAVLPLFGLGYESGIDLVWCKVLNSSMRDCAVIDAVQVRHCKPVGGQKALNGFIGERRYEDDIHAVLARFELPWVPCLPFLAIDSQGQPCASRWQLLLHANAIWCAALTRRPRGPRIRAIATHFKHLLTARPREWCEGAQT